METWIWQTMKQQLIRRRIKGNIGFLWDNTPIISRSRSHYFISRRKISCFEVFALCELVFWMSCYPNLSTFMGHFSVRAGILLCSAFSYDEVDAIDATYNHCICISCNYHILLFLALSLSRQNISDSFQLYRSLYLYEEVICSFLHFF